MIFFSFGGFGGPIVLNNGFFRFQFVRDPGLNRLINIGLMVGMYLLPIILNSGFSSSHQYSFYIDENGNYRQYRVPSRINQRPLTLLDTLWNGILPFVLGFILLGVLSGRYRGLSFTQAFLQFVRNPFAAIRSFIEFNIANGQGPLASDRPPLDRGKVSMAIAKLPTEPFISEATLSGMALHDLKERCRRAGISTEGCLEKKDVIARLAEAGGTTGNSCSICFCDYEEHADVLRVLPCKHKFHVSCVDQWAFTCIETHNKLPTCPVCTKEFGND